MDLASAHPTESKHSDPPIAYINVRRREPRPPQPPVNPHQSEDEDEDDSGRDGQSTDATAKQDDRRSDGVLLNHIQSRFQALLPMLTSPSRTEHTSASVPDSRVYSSGSSRDGNARFARAPSGSGAARNRGSARPAPSSPRDPPERRDSAMTASESSSQDQASQGTQLGTGPPSPGAPYRRPGKHRVGESPSPEEYMALPPEAKKKVDNRLSARRSRAKRKEHVHILTSQIAEQQNTIEMLRIENKQLNDHIANLSRAGYSLHPPPFQPGLVPHPHPSPHLRHVSGPSHIPAHGRHLPPVSHPALPHLVPSPTLSSRGHPSSSSGLVAAAAPPTGPGHVPILGHNVASRSDTSGSSYAAQGHSGPRYDSPGRGTKREVDDDVDDRLRTRVRYASPERMNWDRESQGRRMSQSSHRSPSQSIDYHSRYGSKQRGPSSRSPFPQHSLRWERLPPSLAATRRDAAEEVFDHRTPIQITGQGAFSDRLATLIRAHKRAIITYQNSRRGHMSGREEERMEGVLAAAEAIGKEVEELTEEFHYVGRQDAD